MTQLSIEPARLHFRELGYRRKIALDLKDVQSAIHHVNEFENEQRRDREARGRYEAETRNEAYEWLMNR